MSLWSSLAWCIQLLPGSPLSFVWFVVKDFRFVFNRNFISSHFWLSHQVSCNRIGVVNPTVFKFIFGFCVVYLVCGFNDLLLIEVKIFSFGVFSNLLWTSLLLGFHDSCHSGHIFPGSFNFGQVLLSFVADCCECLQWLWFEQLSESFCSFVSNVVTIVLLCSFHAQRSLLSSGPRSSVTIVFLYGIRVTIAAVVFVTFLPMVSKFSISA
jgi:hypothetical protein